MPGKGRPKKGRTSRTVVPPAINKTAPVIVINKRDNHDLPKKKEDRISQLPDHILITILSQLSLCEAATSSLLSKRWISLWTRVTSLCFDPLVYTMNWKVYDKASRLRKVEAERSKCRSWVNQVLQSYQGSTLDQFQLTLHPDSECVADIDNWIDFAIRKKVQRLHLHLDTPFSKEFRYTFPDNVFIHLKPSSCITNLTTLYLRNIHITDHHLEYFLSKSPLLERLYLGLVFNLNHLNVAAPRLKILQLFHCWGLLTLELFVPNLVSFIYKAFQKGTKILIKHAPSLVQVWLDDSFNITSLDFQRTLSCFSHLVTLALGMSPQVIFRLSHLPEFTCLKNLTFRVSYHSEYVLAWISLIERAPSLHQFTLQVLGESVRSHDVSLAPEFRHECLKVVELCGFNGKSVDTDVATYLIQIPIALDKIIIDLHGWDSTAERRAPMEKIKVKKLRECALQLKTRLPPGAELLII